MADIVKQSLTSQVHDRLVNMLSLKEIKVGSRIDIRKFTEELSVSRTTVNKAVALLATAGWIRRNKKAQLILAGYPPKGKVRNDTPFDFSNQTDSTFEVLLERILRGDLEPGKIVKERPLANELGINPATVRRAAEWLRTDGLLVRLPRRGWQVAFLDVRDVKDIYEIRLLLEPLAIQGAVRRISDDVLNELEAECDRLIAAGEKIGVYERRRADHHFHHTLCESCGSRVLAQTLDPLIRKLLLITTVGFRYGRESRSFEEHKEVVQALRQRDPEEAAKRLKTHLRSALKFNLDNWERH